MQETQHSFVPVTAANISVSTANLPSLLGDWVLDCDVRQHSNRTQESRHERVGKLITFLQMRQKERCSVMELRLFFQHLNNGHKEPGGRFENPRLTNPVKSGTVKSYYSTIRAFFNWLVKQEYLPISPRSSI